MFCPNCGTQLPDGSAFCSNCGTKIASAANEPLSNPAPQGSIEPQSVRETIQSQNTFHPGMAGGNAQLGSGKPSSIYAWIMSAILLLFLGILVFELVILRHEDPMIMKIVDINNPGINFLNILFSAALIFLDRRECKKYGIEMHIVMCLICVLFGGMLLYPVYLFSRARKTDQKYGYFIVSIIPYIFIVILAAYALIRAVIR